MPIQTMRGYVEAAESLMWQSPMWTCWNLNGMHQRGETRNQKLHSSSLGRANQGWSNQVRASTIQGMTGRRLKTPSPNMPCFAMAMTGRWLSHLRVKSKIPSGYKRRATWLSLRDCSLARTTTVLSGRDRGPTKQVQVVQGIALKSLGWSRPHPTQIR